MARMRVRGMKRALARDIAEEASLNPISIGKFLRSRGYEEAVRSSCVSPRGTVGATRSGASSL
jgi:hypothetical protein